MRVDTLQQFIFQLMIEPKSSRAESTAATRDYRPTLERLTTSQFLEYKSFVVTDVRTFIMNFSLVRLKAFPFFDIAYKYPPRSSEKHVTTQQKSILQRWRVH